MATVMSWGNSEGTQGRCDARCHNAALPKCDCMCGGTFHGSAHNGTFEQVVQEHGKALIEHLTEQGKIRPTQGRMFA